MEELRRRLEEAGPDLAWIEALAASVLDGPAPNAALQELIEAFSDDAPLREASGAALREILGSRSARRLLGAAGLPHKPGFFSEAAHRLAKRILPEAPREQDLADLSARILSTEARIDNLLALEAERLARLFVLLDGPFASMTAAGADALRHLCIRTAAKGLSEDLGAPPCFTRLAALADRPGPELRETVASCRAVLAEVASAHETRGVSVDLVFRLEAIGGGLDRIEALSLQLETGDLASGLRLLASVARDQLREQGIGDLVRRNTRLLSKRIAEHSGETGAHYVTSTRAEWLAMFARGSGAGIVTAGTTLAKFGIFALGIALFPEACLVAFNYAGSFLLIQALGFTLATKQPSMTAATLARSLRADPDFTELVETTARMTRSQVAALAGNLLAVIPAALLADHVWRGLTGGPVLSAATAHHAIEALSPVASGTVPYAALTGVLLWASSVLAGAVHNWAICRRLPEAIAASPKVQGWIGEAGAGRLGHALEHGIAGIASNASFGGLLAVTTLAGKFFGLPLDVRHVTLSTGSLALAVGSLGPSVLVTPGFLGALLGIAAVACLNFGVSFSLALAVAARAQGLGTGVGRRFFTAVRARWRSSRRDFFLPPPEPASEEELVPAPERTVDLYGAG